MEKNIVLNSLQAFVNQTPGFCLRDYDSMANYRADYAPVLRDKKTFSILVNFILTHDITGDDILEASKRAFSGRLTIDETTGEITYCVGQYWPTEYRVAACSVLASAIWAYLRTQVPADVEHMGVYIRKMARDYFGRGIQQSYFN